MSRSTGTMTSAWSIRDTPAYLSNPFAKERLPLLVCPSAARVADRDALANLTWNRRIGSRRALANAGGTHVRRELTQPVAYRWSDARFRLTIR